LGSFGFRVERVNINARYLLSSLGKIFEVWNLAAVNILVLDDEPAVLWAFAQIFSGSPMTVYTARNGEDGLAILSKRKISLIFCDVRMPVMGGIKFAYRLRENPETMNLPLVFMTGNQSVDCEQAMTECRAIDLLVKPLDTKLIRSLATKVHEMPELSDESVNETLSA
jgi:CheY-like chemotaxis protein